MITVETPLRFNITTNMNVHIDYETFSEADIGSVGAYKYAEHRSTEIILCGIAKEKEEPVIWDFSRSKKENQPAMELLREASTNPDTVIYAWNAPFEIAISKYLWKSTFGLPCPQLEQWRCVQAMARRAAMPNDLGECAAAIVSQTNSFESRKKSKDAIGKKLIKFFCEPQGKGKHEGKRFMPDDETIVTCLGEKVKICDLWKRFREYNWQDVRDEQSIHEALAPFELKGRTLKYFQFDLRMNDRGIPVNVKALTRASEIVDEVMVGAEKRFNQLTGLKPSQREKVLKWLQERGYPGEDLQAATMEAVLSDNTGMDHYALEVLTLRSRLSFAAVKKVPAMLDAACKDGRVRGCLQWSGAQRTHRWAGKIIQPQNFKRPWKGTEDFYQDLCKGWDVRSLTMIWDNPLDGIASAIRHFIHPENGLKDADYSNIEARITPWIAGQNDLLEQFANLDRLKREGADKKAIAKVEPYVVMATKIFDKKGENITGDERFVGKQAILGAGFGCGWQKFQTMCAGYGRNLDDELCEKTITTYRKTNDKIVSVWKAFQNAAVDAIENPDEAFTVRGKVTLVMSSQTRFPALMMVLPSKHCLVYPYPEVRPLWIFRKQKYKVESEAVRMYRYHRERGSLKDGERVWETKEITFFGPGDNTQWGRQSTYGGKLFENCVQAVAGDFLSHGLLKAEEAGFEVFMVIHDQTLAEHKPEQTIGDFKSALCNLPSWAEGFPLDASCNITKFYSKD